MVCCALIALLFASFLWLLRKINPFHNAYNAGPLEWVLDESTSINSPQKPQFSFKARAESFVFAWDGVRSLVKSEHNAWIHGAATLVILVVAFSLKISLSDWRWIILCIAVVWIAEAINTSIERLSDVVSNDYHEGIKMTKDIAASAVLMSAFCAIAIGMATLLPYFVNPLWHGMFWTDICRTIL